MQKNTSNSTTLLLTLSAAFEYYDFVIYALMATYLGPLFFPHDNELVSQLQAFSVFALGYVVRPLGGMFFGSLADLINRKRIFIISNIILGLATIALSCLPSYAQIGLTATFAIIALRIIQSFSFAAEIPGAMALIKDNNKETSKSFSFIVSGASIGSILASATLYLLEKNFAKSEILEFAWRIPFIFGAILCFVSMIMRRKLPDSAPSKNLDKKTWITQVMAEYRKVIAYILLIFIPAYMIMMNLFFPSFITKFYDYQLSQVYFAITASLIWAMLYGPIFAFITSKLNKITLLQSIIVATIFTAFIVNSLLSNGHIIIGLCLYQSVITSLMVVIFPAMADSFNSSSRFTLMATCYNISFSIIAFAPNAITGLATSWNSPLVLWAGLAFLCVFALANMSAIYTRRI